MEFVFAERIEEVLAAAIPELPISAGEATLATANSK
jgi:hypothetical protein